MVTTTAGRAQGYSATAVLVRGVIGGLIAGAIFIALNMWFSTSTGGPPNGPLLAISTIVKGDAAMAAGATSVPLGWFVHFVLSALFGLVFALAAARLGTNGSLALAGVVYGALLYVVNFQILAPLFFKVFTGANQPFELVAHVVFGVVLSLLLFSSGLRHGEPLISLGSGGSRTARPVSS